VILVLPCPLCFPILAHVSWIHPESSHFYSVPRLDYCCLPGLSLFALPPVGYCSLIVYPRLPSVSCLGHTCLLFIDLACIMTMFWNKALHMEPHVSHLVWPVKEYPAPGIQQLSLWILARYGYQRMECC